MRLHLDLWAQEFRRQGMSDADAQAAALRRFGDPRVYRDHVASRAEAIIGLRVTRQDGSVPGLGSSAIRNAFRIVEGLPLYMPGFFVAAFTRGRRRIGDFAAQTYVLEHAVTLPERITVVFLWLAGISAAVWGAWMLCPTWFQLPLR